MILTYTKKEIDCLDINPGDIDIDDIAYAGSNICRFGGHCQFYSINEHQLFCLRVMQTLTDDVDLHFCALTHDVCEVYSPIGDCVKPYKHAFKVHMEDGLILSVNEYESYLQERIIFGLTKRKFNYEDPLIKRVDKIALQTEEFFIRGMQKKPNSEMMPHLWAPNRDETPTVYRKTLQELLLRVVEVA